LRDPAEEEIPLLNALLELLGRAQHQVQREGRLDAFEYLDGLPAAFPTERQYDH
jgi:hypothetical protein